MRLSTVVKSFKEVASITMSGSLGWFPRRGTEAENDPDVRVWEVRTNAREIERWRLEHPRRYAAFQVGITLITWALRPDDYMERLKQAALPVAVDNDLADALLTILGVAFDETKQEEKR